MRYRPYDLERLKIWILFVLGTASLVAYVVIKVMFGKEPSDTLLSGGFVSVVSGILGRMGDSKATTTQANSGTTINEVIPEAGTMRRIEPKLATPVVDPETD